MLHTPFSVEHKIDNIINWYGTTYKFYRREKNTFNEPTESKEFVQTIEGIYHSSRQSFVALINTEDASVKSKINVGILCRASEEIVLKQEDELEISNLIYKVTTIEPVLYGNTIVAHEISLEEVLE